MEKANIKHTLSLFILYGGVSGAAVRTPTDYTGVHWFKSQLCSLCQFPADTQSGKEQLIAPFSLCHPYGSSRFNSALLQAVGERKSRGELSTYLSNKKHVY